MATTTTTAGTAAATATAATAATAPATIQRHHYRCGLLLCRWLGLGLA